MRGWSHGQEIEVFPGVSGAFVATHLAFEAKNQLEVEAFYEAALAAGATDNGGPGYRDYWPGYYAALVCDPDGHNIEALWYDYGKVD